MQAQVYASASLSVGMTLYTCVCVYAYMGSIADWNRQSSPLALFL